MSCSSSLLSTKVAGQDSQTSSVGGEGLAGGFDSHLVSGESDAAPDPEALLREFNVVDIAATSRTSKHSAMFLVSSRGQDGSKVALRVSRASSFSGSPAVSAGDWLLLGSGQQLHVVGCRGGRGDWCGLGGCGVASLDSSSLLVLVVGMHVISASSLLLCVSRCWVTAFLPHDAHGSTVSRDVGKM